MSTSITIEVPDAWISEDNVLYLVHQHPVGMPALAERANRELEEWDYPHRFDASTLLAARERLWVDPAFIMSEQWPTSAVSREARDGWVRVLRIDLDTVETYDGGSWLYDTAEEARNAARDYDWVTDGEHDFCDRHRDDLTEPEER